MRWLFGVAGVLALLVAVGIGVRHELTRTDLVSIEDVIARMGGDFGPPRDGLPVPGVYVLEAGGAESIDALGGVEHEFPALAPLSVRIQDCGFVATWELLAQRWEQSLVCPSGLGWELQRVTSYHEFFKVPDERTYTCAPQALLLPADARVGDRFTTDCTAPAGGRSPVTTLRWTSEVVGIEPWEGVPDVVHLRVALDHVRGDIVGGAQLERWIDPRTGLVLRETKDGSTVSPSAVGDVTHTERYDLRVRDLEPRR